MHPNINYEELAPRAPVLGRHSICFESELCVCVWWWGVCMCVMWSITDSLQQHHTTQGINPSVLQKEEEQRPAPKTTIQPLSLSLSISTKNLAFLSVSCHSGSPPLTYKVYISFLSFLAAAPHTHKPNILKGRSCIGWEEEMYTGGKPPAIRGLAVTPLAFHTPSSGDCRTEGGSSRSASPTQSPKGSPRINLEPHQVHIAVLCGLSGILGAGGEHKRDEITMWRLIIICHAEECNSCLLHRWSI